jgi:dTDP-4-amino-4,6-dideoxygalactose transaminase
MPCDFVEINALVRKESIQAKFKANSENQEKLGRILVLSDAAHSIGARYNGKMTGTLTDVSVFSFHAVKNLTTAEGGAIALNLPEPFDNKAIYDALCISTLHGQNKDALAKMQKGNWKYDIIEPGYKCNMTDLMAAIGLIELKRYENDTLVKRKLVCEYYANHFKNFEWAQLPPLKNDLVETSYHLYPIRIKGITEVQRDAIIQKIFDADVSVNVHFIPLAMLSFYKNRGYDIANYPVTYDNYSREISLPVFYDLSEEMLKRIVDAVTNAVASTLS